MTGSSTARTFQVRVLTHAGVGSVIGLPAGERGAGEAGLSRLPENRCGAPYPIAEAGANAKDGWMSCGYGGRSVSVRLEWCLTCRFTR
ncbi:hypothetical protein GCM10018779_32540 [Streptomyces griseocarneus]|nr:hypothetical protein GCM10018779_32540 [Streptomyces griseocarneus]